MNNNDMTQQSGADLNKITDKDMMVAIYSLINNFNSKLDNGLQEIEQSSMKKMLEYLNGNDYKNFLEDQVTKILASRSQTPLSEASKQKEISQNLEGTNSNLGSSSLGNADFLNNIL